MRKVSNPYDLYIFELYMFNKTTKKPNEDTRYFRIDL